MTELIEHQYLLLLLLAILVNLYAETYRNRILMYFLLIVLILSVGQIFYKQLHGNSLYSLSKILFSSVYFGPVLYIYLLSIYNNNNNRILFWKHFIIPVLIVVSIKILKLYFEFSQSEILPLVFVGALIPFYYFVKGISFIKSHSLNSSVIARPRFILFYAITNVYILISSIIFFISLFYYVNIDILVNLSDSISGFYYNNIMQPLFILFVVMISLYALTEASWLRKYIVKDTLMFNTKLENKEINALYNTIKNDITSKKRYLGSSLSIKEYSNLMNIDIDIINAYVAHEKFRNFVHLLNFHRVEKFKSLVKSEDMTNYTLLGIATECGFRSKSTFFRVFKEFEGITPKTFLEENTSTSLH